MFRVPRDDIRILHPRETYSSSAVTWAYRHRNILERWPRVAWRGRFPAPKDLPLRFTGERATNDGAVIRGRHQLSAVVKEANLFGMRGDDRAD